MKQKYYNNIFLIIFALTLLLLTYLIYYYIYNYNTALKIHTYLISLPIDIERRKNFEKYYKDKYEYFEAVNGNELKHTSIFKDWGCLDPDKQSHVGTKALQLTTSKVFEDALNKNYDWIVIFQDDAEPPEGFNINNIKEIIKKYSDSLIIYLDNRNPEGDGVIPDCCLSGMIYHKYVFKILANELNPEKGTYLQNYGNKDKKIMNHNDCLHDWFLANLIAENGFKTSSAPLVYSGRFDSRISTT